MRPRLPALTALATLLLVGAAHADPDADTDDDPFTPDPTDELPPLAPLPDLPELTPAPAPSLTPSLTLTPTPSPSPSPTPTLTPSLTPSPSASLLHVPSSPSAPLGQYDEYRRPIPAYAIDAAPVTSARYDACVVAGHCTRSTCSAPSPEARVACVDLAQATAFCSFAGARLPTEEEWEHAAREASSLGMRGTDDAAEWTSSPYCYFCGRDDQVVRGGPARNPSLRGWRAPGAHEAGVGFRCARAT